VKIFISVISHGHFSVIQDIGVIPELANMDDVTILVRDNIGDKGLREFCDENKILYVENSSQFGFAKNNNLNFHWFSRHFSVSDDDLFLILNPDFFISTDDLRIFQEFVSASSFQLTSILQYSNEDKSTIEPSARMFEGPLALILERFFIGRKTLVPNQGINTSFDWVSGAFIGVSFSLYSDVGGFCEDYFMYYEDADFCLKCKKAGHELTINTDVSGIHYAQYANRKIFSKLFFMSVKSYTRFLIRLLGYKIATTFKYFLSRWDRS
jgi:N-acetylglucosaminyl-diphospho-decaprenol L-rhamnosyltransferase